LISLHPTVAQHGHIVDRVRPGEHPAQQRPDFLADIRSAVDRDTQPPAGEAATAALVA